LQVEQLSCVVPQEHLMTYLLAVIKTHMQQDQDYKAGYQSRFSHRIYVYDISHI